MPYRDQREFLAQLQKEGQLHRINKEVDWDLEIGAILRKLTDMGQRWPAVLFEKVKNYPSDFKLVANLLTNFPRMAIALGLPGPLLHWRLYTSTRSASGIR